VISAAFGGTFTYDTLTIFTPVEEGGELNILHSKDFADPEKRMAFLAGMANAAA
jgi:hypothetical protein